MFYYAQGNRSARVITQERLRYLFEYKDGALIWKRDTINTKAGDIAGGLNKASGYRSIGVDGVRYLLHRLIYLFHNNELPRCLDHIDCNPLNNHIENLRPTTHSQNQQNTKLRVDNKSGVKGVNWREDIGKYRTYISLKGKRILLGNFKDIKLAEKTVREARIKYHGEFANHGG